MFKHLKADIPASIVVFFVALPLCLGVALASDAPPFAGLIAGIIGGIVVGLASGSRIGVSGPAAGLAAIVASAIGTLGSFEAFLTAVVIAGFIQIIFGIARFGIIGYFFPNSVIVGMLTGIGILIILKQVPHLFGYDATPMGADDFIQRDGENSLSALGQLASRFTPGAALVGLIGLGIILLWDNLLGPKHKFFKLVQGPIIAVAIGTALKLALDGSDLAIVPEHLVTIPVIKDAVSLRAAFSFPDWSVITSPAMWTVAATLALVASLETLLSVEATDKLDPNKNVTPTNRELIAQGIGNLGSGLVGGLPITQVIVRSSANVQSGAKSKLSTVIHGSLLLLSVLLIPAVLNHIPNAVLAAVLIVVGYKLAKPALFVKMWKLGWTQFAPFIITIVTIVFTNLLIGIAAGLAFGIFVVLFKSYQNSMFLHRQQLGDKQHARMTLAEEVTFLNKAAIQKELTSLPSDSHLELDVRATVYLDHDVVEILNDFATQAKRRNIHVTVKTEQGDVENPASYIELFHLARKSD